jgi:hypothetical protein
MARELLDISAAKLQADQSNSDATNNVSMTLNELATLAMTWCEASSVRCSLCLNFSTSQSIFVSPSRSRCPTRTLSSSHSVVCIFFFALCRLHILLRTLSFAYSRFTLAPSRFRARVRVITLDQSLCAHGCQFSLLYSLASKRERVVRSLRSRARVVRSLQSGARVVRLLRSGTCGSLASKRGTCGSLASKRGTTRALCAVLCALCSVRCALCAVRCALCAVRCAL